MNLLFYLSMVIVLLVGLLPTATVAQPPYAAGQQAAGQPGIDSPQRF